MMLQKLIEAHKKAFLTQDKEKYFFDLKFQFLDGTQIYAHKFFLLACSPKFQEFIDSADKADTTAPHQARNGFKELLEQCYEDSIVYNPCTHDFKESNKKAKKIAKNRFFMGFMNQNIESGHFDVAFKFKDGKILYAHKFMLVCLSPIFETMFTKNWDKQEYIDIIYNSYDDFKEFLSFFYLGKCNFKENIALYSDFAECYSVSLLKNYIEDNIDITIENASERCELARIYNLNFDKKFTKELVSSILKNGIFLEFKKELILTLVKNENLEVNEEVIFMKIVIWAENQCQFCKTTTRMHQMMRKILIDIFPYIRFAVMDFDFVYQFVCDYDELLTPDERNNILQDICIIKERKKFNDIYKINLNRSHRLIQIKDKRGHCITDKFLFFNHKLWQQIFEFEKVTSIKTEDGICWKSIKNLTNNYKIESCYVVGYDAYYLVINEMGELYLKDELDDHKVYVVATFNKIPEFIFDEGCIVRVF